MHADGSSRHVPVVAVGLNGTKRIEGDPCTHSRCKCGNHGCDGHQGGYEYHLALMGGPELLNDFLDQVKRRKHVPRPSLPLLEPPTV